MSAVLEWFGEQFPPYGALAAEGFGKLLGRPSLDSLTVLVRETAQNSWDARLSGSTVRYAIDGFTLSDHQRETIAHRVYAYIPEEGLPLVRRSLEKRSLDALVISDRGTVGLGGPTRADEPTDGPTDYIDLLMNVGIGGHDLGGGTYGFGKTIAYLVSNARTIIVHSRTSSGLAAPETRLIASAIGEKFVRRQKRYTGRHWWGRTGDGVPEPLTGRPAEELARAMGFPGFADDETGTSIMVLDPDFGDREPSDAMRFLADAITWNLWPKMVPDHGRTPMAFSVTWNGQRIPVARPDELPPLTGFRRALEALHTHPEPFRQEDGLEVLDIRAKRPNRRLGRLALYTFVTAPRPIQRCAFDAQDAEEEIEPLNAAAFTGNAHHVALMRAPELVVRYLPGPEFPDTALEWAGVFICDRDLDPAFAASEPPTHDDWQPPLVSEKHDRRVVNIALREIREAARSRATGVPEPAPPGTTSVALVADALAGLMAGIPDSGAGRAPPASKSGQRPAQGRVTIGDARCGPVLEDGTRLTRLDFKLTVPGPRTVSLDVSVGVATRDGTGIEADPPAGSPVPELVRIEGPVSRALSGQAVVVRAQITESNNWTVFATSPEDVMVAFDVQAEAV